MMEPTGNEPTETGPTETGPTETEPTETEAAAELQDLVSALLAEAADEPSEAEQDA